MPRRPLALAVALLLGSCGGEDGASAPANDVPDATPDVADGAPGAADAAPDTAIDAAPVPFSEKLSAMDLYEDLAKKTIHPRNTEFRPRFELWSDGAEKRRWIALPKGSKIDSSDMDHWVFPVGTRVWKEFARGEKRLETRLVEKTGEDSFRMGTYLWNDAQTEATWSTVGANDVLGTTHDVPSETSCHRCHEGEPGRVLGFSAIQLAGAPGPTTLASVTAWLTVAPPAGVGVPGDATESAALGYLHANCGSCHNPNDTLTFVAAGSELRLNVGEREVGKTKLFLTNVNVKTERFTSIPYRIAGGDTASSAIHIRMNRRDGSAMPMLGTEQVDPSGLAAVKAWIDTLPAP
ncbi:MAG: hypothetical protein HYV09_22270 [Deltaproteobacteria bacterium]|nr:hypothetical protein [Deltaproteobacteria bacterium]